MNLGEFEQKDCLDKVFMLSSMKAPSSNGYVSNPTEGERKAINSELWHACAGPLVSLPPVGSLVVYFPQGHSEQVAASMQKETDGIPSYPNLPSKLVCMLHNVTLQADAETDEVYAQMTLQPVNKYDQDALLISDMGLKQSRQPAEFFCKTLTASDTSTHGGFSVPRRAAEKIFPPLDFTMQPPAQEIVARDLHDQTWTFRHIFRGQPKRHLLTTGWSVFVSSKRLFAGDSVLFIRDEKSQLLLGIRRANRQQPALSSSVISSDSMHIGILAAAAHAAANNSPFTIFYNPRASPAEFVIPLAKYNKAMYAQVSLGMRFRMMFETEESGVRRYMGTITGISDLDATRWKSSQWRNLQVGWDESTAGERPSRVSIWDIEPVVTPFYICPPPFFRPKFPRQAGLPDDESDMENAFKRGMPWLDDYGMKDASNSILPGLSLVQWMSMQQNQRFPGTQPASFSPVVSSTALQSSLGTDDPSKLLNFQTPALSLPNLQFNKANQQNQPGGQMQQSSLAWHQQQQMQQLLQTSANQQQQQQHSQQQHQHQQHQQQQQHQQHQQQQQHQQHQQQQHQQHQQQQQQQQQHQQKQSLQQNQQSQLPQQQQLQQPLVQVQQPIQQVQQPRPQQLHQQQQILQSSLVNNGGVSSNQIPIQSSLQPINYSQLQQQQLLAGNTQLQQTSPVTNRNSVQLSSLPQDVQFQQSMEQMSRPQQQHPQLQQAQMQLLQQSLSQRPQMHNTLQQSLSEQQLQLLQKLQQQQQQLPTPVSPRLDPQLPLQQQAFQQNRQSQQMSMSQQQISGNSFSASMLLPLAQFPMNQLLSQHKPLGINRAHSGITDGDAPSCSTSPSTNNCQVAPSNFLNKNQQGPGGFLDESVVGPATNSLQELQSRSDIRMKHEISNPKGPDQPKYKGIASDQPEASSSATSYCLEVGGLQNFSLPGFTLDGDVQSHVKSDLPFAVNIDGLTPDALLSRGFDSQNVLSNYGGTPRDIETELSTAIDSQSFGVPNMSFKPVCSNDVDIAMNEAGVASSGLWGNQTQRMRTYTKVQKRGSVGRTIDVTRYKGYDDLRHDLARMFGIEGQLQDPQRNEWKLVYVDNENDILLVGDDPWEEFLGCVQSIKILSSAEVQQMSLDGDLGNVAVLNQTCSGSDSGNAWKGQYDDNSAASFNR